MAITDKEGNAIVTLSSVWEAAFKLLLVLTPFVGVMLFTWGTWVTMQIFDHSSTLRLLQHNAGVAKTTRQATEPAALTPPRPSSDSHEPNHTCP